MPDTDALAETRCAGCRVLFHGAPDPRLGLPVRCLPCADLEADRLRGLAMGRRRALDLDALLGFEALKGQPMTGQGEMFGAAATAPPAPPRSSGVSAPPAVGAGGCADAVPRAGEACPDSPLAARGEAAGKPAAGVNAARCRPLAPSRPFPGRSWEGPDAA